MKIYDSVYWKQHCFALTAQTVIDKAIQLKYIGGTYGGSRKPTNFLCLVLKLLQLAPEREIILEYIKNDDFKYVRLLGAVYLRLTGRPMEIYQYLEPVLNDFRKVRLRQIDGSFTITHVDEIVDQLLRDFQIFDIAMPRLPLRKHLEENSKLPPRKSALLEALDDDELFQLSATVDAEIEAQRLQKESQRRQAREASLSTSVSSAHDRNSSRESPRRQRIRSTSPRHRSRSR